MRGNAMADEAKDTLTQLKNVRDANFDKQYMDAQIREHQKLLDLLDKELIKSADNGALKEFLENLRPKVAFHLTKAREIRKQLDKY
jgi:putative membrane protein